jgi:phosphomannomutase
VIWGDQLLMIYAEDLLAMEPGSTIIADVKASSALFDQVERLGGHPLMWKTGHSLIKSKMKELSAPLAGEMSGHVFFAHQYYGYDDALYAAVRLIAASARLGKSVTELRAAMPALSTRRKCASRSMKAASSRWSTKWRRGSAAAGAVVNGIDGVRVSTADGWWLLRASNTQDVLVARAESETEAGLDRLIAQIDEQLALSGVERGPQAGH